jgi:activator of HSP90 ATPase
MEIILTTKIKNSAEKIYSAWLSSEGHTKMTGGEATCSNKEGAAYSAWDGYIKGKTIKLVPFSKIVQTWRTDQFEENESDSLIEILLSEKNGETELTLIHSNIPESGEHYRRGWEEHYFTPMKSFFS